MLDSEREARELDRQAEVIVRRTAIRTETVAELLAGRLTAEEAVRRFDDLNRLEPGTLAHLRGLYEGQTDEERAAWQLVAHVRNHPDPRAQEVAAETACRLAYPAD